MNEQHNDIWLIIAAVWNGSATPEEKIIFKKWLNESEENNQFYEIVNRITSVKKQFDNEIKSRVFSNIKGVIIPNQFVRRLNFWRYSTVASIAILITLSFVLVFKKARMPAETALIDARTQFGIKSKISLSDGTIVYLNAGSCLQYPAIFSDEQRLVIIKGEAYFDVSKDPKRPFIVQAGQLNIKVTGTQFNVKAYSEDEFVETTLLEGSVGIYNNSDIEQKNGIELKPDEQAVYYTNSGKINLRKVDAKLSTLWKDGKYYFENEPLASITKKLERNFNIPIRITSQEISNESFYGLFTKSKNLFQILDVIKIHSNFNYTVKNDTIFINKN